MSDIIGIQQDFSKYVIAQLKLLGFECAIRERY